MTKNKEKIIEEIDKSEWKKLDEIVDFKLSLEGKWVQKGPYIINTAGELDFAIYVGNDKKLIGLDDSGRPILKKFDD